MIHVPLLLIAFLKAASLSTIDAVVFTSVAPCDVVAPGDVVVAGGVVPVPLLPVLLLPPQPANEDTKETISRSINVFFIRILLSNYLSVIS
jgi:hypothetical protein